jgi:hypothetical protein
MFGPFGTRVLINRCSTGCARHLTREGNVSIQDTWHGWPSGHRTPMRKACRKQAYGANPCVLASLRPCVRDSSGRRNGETGRTSDPGDVNKPFVTDSPAKVLYCRKYLKPIPTGTLGAGRLKTDLGFCHSFFRRPEGIIAKIIPGGRNLTRSPSPARLDRPPGRPS